MKETNVFASGSGKGVAEINWVGTRESFWGHRNVLCGDGSLGSTGIGVDPNSSNNITDVCISLYGKAYFNCKKSRNFF